MFAGPNGVHYRGALLYHKLLLITLRASIVRVRIPKPLSKDTSNWTSYNYRIIIIVTCLHAFLYISLSLNYSHRFSPL